MRKLTSWLKSTTAVALVLSAATGASAVTLEKGSKYSFTCTYEVVDASAASSLLGSSFEFTLPSTSTLDIQFNNFVSTLYNGTHSSQTGNVIQLWQKFGGFNDTEGLAFSNEAGVYPFGCGANGWAETYVNITVSEDGNLSIPDFTVVRYSITDTDNNNGIASVVAKYSNCQITLISGGAEDNGGDNPGGGDEPGAPSFTGSYTFRGTYTGADGVGMTSEFEFVINESNEPIKMLGYKLDGPNSTGHNKFTVTETTYKVSNFYLAMPVPTDNPMFFLLIGGPNTSSYSNSGITLTDNGNGNYTISNFTIWKGITENAEAISSYEYVGSWSDMTCVNYTESTDPSFSASPFAGKYTGQVDITDYVSGSFGTTLWDQPFSLEINSENELVSLCGYTPVETLKGTIIESETATICQFNWNLNTLVKDAEGNTYLLTSRVMEWDDEEEGFISLYYEEKDGGMAYRLTPFSIWDTTGNTEYYWYDSANNLEFEKAAAPASKYAGTYTGTTDLIDYSVDFNGAEKYDQPFSLEINADNQLVSICGYTPVGTITGTVGETETADTLSFPWTLNTKVTGADGTVYALNGNTEWDDDEEGTITLYFDNGKYRMGAFSIWKEDNSQIVYYYYSANGLEFTPAVSDEPTQPGADTYVVYNDGQLNSELHYYEWWNPAVDTQAANPDGNGYALQFKAADGTAAASAGYNMETPQNTGILHNATLNFKWYANTSATYTIRLTAGGGAANEYNYTFTPAANELNQWNSTSINIAEEWPELAQKWNDNVNLGNGYVFSFILENGKPESVIYFNDVYYNNVDENWEAPVVEYPAPETVLVPEYGESLVASVYSPFYPAATGFNIGGWGQSTSVTEVEVDGVKIEWLRNFNYLGYEFVNANEGNCLDLTGYDYMRVDMWTDAENAKFGISPVVRAGSATEKVLTQNVVAGEWNSYEISLSEWADAGLDLSQVFQIKFDNGSGYDCYVTNVLFYKEQDPEAPAAFELPLNITMKGTRIDFDAEGNETAVTNDAQFEIVVKKGSNDYNADGMVYAFGGYEVSQSILQNRTWLQPYVIMSDVVKEIDFKMNPGNTFLEYDNNEGVAEGITFNKDRRQWSDNEPDVTLHYNDGNWNLDNFAIYSFKAGEYTKIAEWTDVKALTTGVEDVIVDENAPVEYYNLQGVKVTNPEKGIYIRIQGNKATKILK